jgi:hypothetical protein
MLVHILRKDGSVVRMSHSPTHPQEVLMEFSGTSYELPKKSLGKISFGQGPGRNSSRTFQEVPRSFQGLCRNFQEVFKDFVGTSRKSSRTL